MRARRPTTGSVETSEECKRQFARDSLAWNLRQPAFLKNFPKMKARAAALTAGPSPAPPELLEAAEAAAATANHPETVRCTAQSAAEQPRRKKPSLR